MLYNAVTEAFVWADKKPLFDRTKLPGSCWVRIEEALTHPSTVEIFLTHSQSHVMFC